MRVLVERQPLRTAQNTKPKMLPPFLGLKSDQKGAAYTAAFAAFKEKNGTQTDKTSL